VTARRPLLVVTAGCVAATALGLVFGQGGTVALASALALAVAAALQLRPPQRQQSPPRARDPEMPLRLRQIVGDLRESEQSESGVDRSLRSLLVPIVAVRLGRRGVDMARAAASAGAARRRAVGLARSFAQVCAMDFARIQFTPGLIPSDITGSAGVTGSRRP
jgi:hypothetical protein